MARWKETSLILFPKRPFSRFLLGNICWPWDPFNLLNNCINISGKITHFQVLSLLSCVKSFRITLQTKGSWISWDIQCQYFWWKQPASKHYLQCIWAFSLLSCVKSFQVTLQMKGSLILGINISGKNNLHLSVIPAKLCQVNWILGQLYKQKALKYPAKKVVIYSFLAINIC